MRDERSGEDHHAVAAIYLTGSYADCAIWHCPRALAPQELPTFEHVNPIKRNKNRSSTQYVVPHREKYKGDASYLEGNSPPALLITALNWIVRKLEERPLEWLTIGAFGPFKSLYRFEQRSYWDPNPHYGALEQHGLQHNSRWGGVNLYEVASKYLQSKELQAKISIHADATLVALGEYIARMPKRVLAAQEGLPNAEFAERRRYMIEHTSLAFLKISYHVAGGLCYGGEVWKGVYHPSIGHLRLPRWRGPNGQVEDTFPGVCALHPEGDCADALISIRAMLKRAGVKNIFEIPPESPHWDVFDYYVAALCHAIAMTSAPGNIYIGGRMIRDPETQNLVEGPSLDRIRAYFSRFVGRFRPPPDIAAPQEEAFQALLQEPDYIDWGCEPYRGIAGGLLVAGRKASQNVRLVSAERLTEKVSNAGSR